MCSFLLRESYLFPKAGALDFSTELVLPLRTNWLIVGIDVSNSPFMEFYLHVTGRIIALSYK